MRSGTFVILHLVNPTEKFWGLLEELLPMGITLRGISVSSFDDWAGQVARGENDEESGLGLVTMFVPLFRVERMFRDEQVGVVESYRQRFARRVGRRVEDFLGADWKEVDSDLPDGAVS
ncbi:MAG: hypothetical protein ACM3OB_02670 [Acidobacteriota bacterium]